MRLFLARMSGVVLALAMFELIVERIYSLSLAWEPEYGYVNAPGKVVRWHREGHASSHWTAHGIRGTDPPNPSTRPILVLGDSFTEGLQVGDDDVYPAHVGKELGARGVAPVWNAGRSSASVADYVAFAARHRRLFSPRWTVVQIRDDDLAEDAFDRSKTHFAERDGRISVEVVLPAKRGRIGTFVWDLRQRLMLVGYGFVRLGEFQRAAYSEPPLFRAGTTQGYEPPRAVAPVETELDVLSDAYETRLTILHLATLDPRAPHEPSEIEKRIFAHCARRGLSCVSTRSDFSELLGKGRSPYGHPNSAWNSGHMNRDGHRLVAERLTVELARLANNGLL